MSKTEEHKQKMAIQTNHTLHFISSHIKSIKGEDVDEIKYEEKDENGNFLTFYIVEDGISKFPPFKKIFSFKKER